MKTINKNCFVVAILCTAFTAPAFASTKSSVVDNRYSTESASVKYGDLNLNKPEGVQTLHGRLEAAVSKVCNIHDGRAPLSVTRKRKECFDETLAEAISQLELKTSAGIVSR